MHLSPVEEHHTTCTCSVVQYRRLFIHQNNVKHRSSFRRPASEKGKQLKSISSLQLQIIQLSWKNSTDIPPLTQVDVALVGDPSAVWTTEEDATKRGLRFSRRCSRSETCLCVCVWCRSHAVLTTYATVSGCFVAICGRRKWRKKNILKNPLKRQFMKKNKNDRGNSDSCYIC